MRSAIAIDPQATLARILKGEYPDARGRFGPFGGRYVPETLVPALYLLQAGVDRYCIASRQPLLGLPAPHQTREICFLIGGDGTMASATARMDATLPSLLAVVNRSRTRFGDFDAVKRDEGAIQSRFTYMMWTRDAPIVVVVGSENDTEGRPSLVAFTVADEASLFTAGAEKVSNRPAGAR